MSHAHDDQIVRGHDSCVWPPAPAMSYVAWQIPLADAIDPELPAMLWPAPRRRRRADELREPLGKKLLTVPHAVAKIQQAEPRPVARRTAVIAADQEVALRIRLEHLFANPDLVEQRAADRSGTARLVFHCLSHEKPERHRIELR